MNRAPSFGFALPQAQAFQKGELEVDDLVAFVQRAEALGYRECVVADHILVPKNWQKVIGDTFLDAMTLLSFVGAVTTELRLVLGCLVVPYRQPLSVAKAVATLDQLSRGRAALGVVPGYLQAEFDALGVPFGEKIPITDEYIAIMRALWTDEHASFDGQYYQFDDWNMLPKCVQQPHVPIWVGGASKGALERAVAVGDVWHPLGFVVISDEFMAANRAEFAGETMQTDGMTPTRLATALGQAEEMAQRHDRDLSNLEVVIMPGPPPAAVDAALPAKITGMQASKGGQRIIDWFGQYVEAGATGFVLGLAGATLGECIDALELTAADVIPALA